MTVRFHSCPPCNLTNHWKLPATYFSMSYVFTVISLRKCFPPLNDLLFFFSRKRSCNSGSHFSRNSRTLRTENLKLFYPLPSVQLFSFRARKKTFHLPQSAVMQGYPTPETTVTILKLNSFTFVPAAEPSNQGTSPGPAKPPSRLPWNTADYWDPHRHASRGVHCLQAGTRLLACPN